MKKNAALLGFSLMTLALTACQTTPLQYNGMTGYQIENQSTNSTTLAYTLAGRKDQQLDQNKLMRACQKVLGTNQNYQLNILSVNEIINPSLGQHDQKNIRLGNTRASFGFSNTQTNTSSDDYATRQALETKPTTLSVVRYTCS